jgi:hypothetical protein
MWVLAEILQVVAVEEVVWIANELSSIGGRFDIFPGA